MKTINLALNEEEQGVVIAALEARHDARRREGRDLGDGDKYAAAKLPYFREAALCIDVAARIRSAQA